MPAYNESLGLVGAGGKYLTRWGRRRAGHGQGDSSLKKELQAIWDKAP